MKTLLTAALLLVTTVILSAELSVSDKMIHYSSPKCEIYSSNFLPIYTPQVSYAFAYSTIRNAYFCLILKDSDRTIKQLRIKEEHKLIEYKLYDDFLVVVSHINPSTNEYYLYDTIKDALSYIDGRELIIVNSKMVYLVYPPHFSADKKAVKLMVDNKEKLSLPYSYYKIEKSGGNKVLLSDTADSTPPVDLDTTTAEVDTSITITI